LRYALRFGGGIIALLIASVSARAQTPATGDTLRLTLPDARAIALRANPALAAVRLDTAVARGELRQAARFFTTNPAVELLSAAGGNGMEAGVSQEIEIFGQQGARASAGRAGLVRARAGISDATRLTIGAVDRTFYQLYAATERSRLVNDVLSLTRRIADVAERQLAAGEISRLDFNLASIELGRTRARALAAERERDAATIELRRRLGIRELKPVVAVLDSTGGTERAPGFDVDSLVRLALGRRPDLAERNAAIRQADALATTAGREGLPNLVARGVSEPVDDGDGRVFRPGFGITIPIFNRNRGRVQALRATTRQAELERNALVETISAEVRTAVSALEAAAAETDVLEATVLPPARQNRELVEIAYREGKVGLPELLLIRNQAIDAELDYWTAWLTERQTLSSLAEATGINLTMEQEP
jgi:cobalt-zinc-cadmium efflux system outer membrane protein